ncbi:thiamine phosphate synthase [Sphingobium sp.]|uniref:thiamine phosphate synthase n=1 Tax=Sphingobium sp. TaxID=1912891 RepID=UPI003BB5979F
MHARHRKNRSFAALPSLWLMTDERVSDAAMLAAVGQLPKGCAGIIFRHYSIQPKARRALFDAVRAIAQRRRLTLLLAGKARTAMAWQADGWHGPTGRKATGRMFHSAAAHDAKEIQAARRHHADLILLSPLFPTRSHPGAAHLGRVRFAALARQARMPVMALGGVNHSHRHMLPGIGADGWAAIDGLTGPYPL